MVNIKIKFHPIVEEYIYICSVAQLNLEVMQHSCVVGEEDYAFYGKIRFFFWLPFLLFGSLGLVGFVLVKMHLRFPQTLSGVSERSLEEPDSPVAAEASNTPAVVRERRIRAQLSSVGCGLFNVLYAPH